MDEGEHENEERCNASNELITDEEAAALAQGGDGDAMLYLLDKYKRMVRLKARSYFLIGADHEDLVQEGMIGLYKAIRDYRPDRQASFYVFSELCIKRQIISAIKAATRQKHIPLNSYVSLNKPLFDEENDKTLLDMLEGNAGDPQDLLISREELINMELHISKVLSPFETQVLNLFLDGKSYQEIARVLDKHVKAVDNALQRIKKKMNKYLTENRR
ncbi:MAG: RNA polymerase sporulation sigma factor SigH [Eubacteriales bacterium]|nr:RNA polymerase sporulation sigma factor SigH [Eubacteriales bacterium]